MLLEIRFRKFFANRVRLSAMGLKFSAAGFSTSVQGVLPISWSAVQLSPAVGEMRGVSLLLLDSEMGLLNLVVVVLEKSDS